MDEYWAIIVVRCDLDERLALRPPDGDAPTTSRLGGGSVPPDRVDRSPRRVSGGDVIVFIERPDGELGSDDCFEGRDF